MSESIRIAVLISGSGTTLKNLLDSKASGSLNADIVQVISSNSNATGNQFATENNIPLSIVQRNKFANDLEFSNEIFQDCRSQQSELVVMGGFLKKVVIPNDFVNRVINIHPSLIPAFSGRGFYGMKVHQAVIDFGCKVSGCTVHFVDNEYDHGPVIAQRPVELGAQDNAETLQKRVFNEECKLYPWVINRIASGNVNIKDRIVTVS